MERNMKENMAAKTIEDKAREYVEKAFSSSLTGTASLGTWKKRNGKGQGKYLAVELCFLGIGILSMANLSMENQMDLAHFVSRNLVKIHWQC